MSTNPRSKPFSLTFHPVCEGEDLGQYKNVPIPVNGPPVEIENAHFKGSIVLVHDTGNEPNAIALAPGSARKGVEMQIQGKFKRSVEKGGQTTHGLWIGGDLGSPLKLGWIMQNVVNLCMKFAKKKCEGRIQSSLFGEVPHVSFPIGQLFTVIRTPAQEDPPPLLSQALADAKWQGAGWVDVDTESTYTILYKTPYLDVCSWELLKVPGVSPLGFESILGDISSARVMLFDLGAAGGSYAEWKKGAILQWTLSRGAPGDGALWNDGDDEQDDSVPNVQAVKTVENDDDASEGSEQVSDAESVVAVEDQAGQMSESSGSGSSSSMDSVEDEAMSIADTQALFEIEGWRPRAIDAPGETARTRVPFYIEAIDRRKKSAVRIWYVVNIADETDEFWIAKAASELASLCAPKRRLKFFWRGAGARKTRANTVRTLEHFRHVVRNHLASDTKLRNVVVGAASALVGDDDEDREGTDNAVERPQSPTRLTPAGIARKVRKSAQARKTGMGKKRLLLPPRFFVGSGSSACALAFAHAHEGRRTVIQERIVGAIHFEGRICEELLRLSADGTLRCFTPYDCDKPRIKIKASEILDVQPIDGLFLGRFYLWQVQTVLRAFVFVSSHLEERSVWVEAVHLAIDAVKAVEAHADVAAERLAGDPDGLPGTSQVMTLSTGAVFNSERTGSKITSQGLNGASTPPPGIPLMESHGSGTGSAAGGAASALQGGAKAGEAKNEAASGGAAPPGTSSQPAGRRQQALTLMTSAIYGKSTFKAPSVLQTDDGEEVYESRRQMLVNKLSSVPNFVPKARINLQMKAQHMSTLLRTALAARGPGNSTSDLTLMLMDSSRARRWRARRLVLNDRLLLPDSVLPPAPTCSEELLESAIRLAATPSVSAEEIVIFSNSVCKLKAVRFKGWTQNELLTFWLNIYHCLLLHGWVLLGSPSNAQETRRFHGRVSYVVGLRPVSLNDIEQVVLKIAQADPGGAVKAQAVTRAQQLRGFVGLFMPWRRPPVQNGQQAPRSGSGTVSPQPSNLSAGSGHHHTQANVVGTCLPMMAIPRVPTPGRQSSDVNNLCLFLGKEAEEVKHPKADKRCVFALVRGTYSCLADIPVFHTNRLNSELDDVVRKFVAEFVHAEAKDGRMVRMDLPERCRSLETEFDYHTQALLEFIAQFLPVDHAKVEGSTKLKIIKGNEEPRPRLEFKKLAYQDPNLLGESFSGLPSVGAEFDAIQGSAKQLAKLASLTPLHGDQNGIEFDDGSPATVLSL